MFLVQQRTERTVAAQQALSVVRAVRNGELDIGSINGLVEDAGYSVNLVALCEANQGRVATTLEQITLEIASAAAVVPRSSCEITTGADTHARHP